MAKAYLCARASAINPAYSPLSFFLFGRVLESLRSLIVAERAMSGMSAAHPALDQCITVAEARRSAVLARLRVLKAACPRSAFEDVAARIAKLMCSDDPDECAQLRDCAMRAREAFLLPARDRVSQRANHLIARALDDLEIYFTLCDGAAGVDLPGCHLARTSDDPAPSTAQVA